MRSMEINIAARGWLKIVYGGLGGQESSRAVFFWTYDLTTGRFASSLFDLMPGRSCDRSPPGGWTWPSSSGSSVAFPTVVPPPGTDMALLAARRSARWEGVNVGDQEVNGPTAEDPP